MSSPQILNEGYLCSSTSPVMVNGFVSEVYKVVSEARFLCLGTSELGRSHLSLMAFTAVPSPPSFKIVFATSRNTRKFHALTSDPVVCMLMHDDSYDTAVALYGSVTVCPPGSGEEAELRAAHLAHNPSYAHFITGENSAVCYLVPSEARFCDLSGVPKQACAPPPPAPPTPVTLQRTLEVPFLHVNAFSSALLGLEGNPGAVLLHAPTDPFPRDADLVRAAAQQNLSETAFLVPFTSPPDDPKKDPFIHSQKFSLRWFTPKKEVRMCGHGTLAAAHALVTRGNPHTTLSFYTLSGILTVEVIRVKLSSSLGGGSGSGSGSSEGGGEGEGCREPPLPATSTLALHLPLSNLAPRSDPIAKSLAYVFLGRAHLGRLVDSQYSRATKKLLLVLQSGSKGILAALAPDMFAAMGVFQPEHADEGVTDECTGPVEGVCITTADAPEGGERGEKGVGGRSICMRYWSPWNGIPEGEDPVNGASHTLLAAYWSEKWKLEKGEEIVSTVLSQRGGTVTIKIHPTKNAVVLTGESVTVSTGLLCVRMTKDVPETAPAAVPAARGGGGGGGGAASASAAVTGGRAAGGVVHI